MSVPVSKGLSNFRGPVYTPGDEMFVRSRAIYNTRMSDQQPSAIARALDADDVIAAVRFAAEQRRGLAIRAGGHGVDGSAMPDDALVVDLSEFKQISVEPDSRRVRLGAGVLLGEMDGALAEYGLVVPAGTVSTTGVAGLTIGGGVGYNMRARGATVDSLLACEIVTTDGRLVRASADENPDLFWAVRGGGGNFGVVVNFEFQAHPIPQMVSAGMIPFSLDQASEVLQSLREYMPTAPRELALIAALTQCPPLPPVPVEAHGTDVLMFVVVFTGPQSDSDRVMAQLASLGRPATVAVQPVPWPAANSMLDVIAPYGRRVYTKGGYLSELSDSAIDATIKHAGIAPAPTAPPTPSTVQNLWALGGAISDDFEEDSCAFSREGATWFWEVATQWDDPSDDATFMAWADALDADLRPEFRDNCYINLTTDLGSAWRKGAWGSPEKYRRLVDAKIKWDPQNMLRYNKNIDPTPTSAV
ncbi:FAD-dependent oxidoreductase [Mycobacterium senriense]|uniref:FAD-linked oxidase n=1 Tax=Mycobacterium senriense TaxID=2775496 RepID=A0ABM7SVH0_9MYCO|nr:FAD-dependent oxidoreductase [Mycobacterium senriense]BCZ21983.1 FAD-linked oxidase [Mycobacterium senriense]